MAIHVDNVTISIASQRILYDSSIQFSDNKWTAIIGENGVGKSTLLQAIHQLTPLTKGQITVNGTIGFLFQQADQQFFESTVEKELRFAPRHAGWSHDKIDAKINDVLALVQLDRSILQMLPYQLSGGQKKRLALATVLMMEPDILLADEPTAGLDPLQHDMMLDVLKTWQQQGHTVIAITHELADVLAFADEVVVMKKGMAPQHIDTEAFFFDAHVRQGFTFPPSVAAFHAVEQHVQRRLPRARTTAELIQIIQQEVAQRGTSD